MNEAGREDEHGRRRRTPAHQRGDGQRAQAEGQLPRMKVALERVGAGPGDRVPQRQRGDERDRRPLRSGTDRLPISQTPVAMERQRDDVQHREQEPAAAPSASASIAITLVDRRQPRLRGDEGAVARKERRIDLLEGRGNVERQVRRAVSVARRVQRAQEDEQGKETGNGQRGNRCSCGVFTYCSSAVGP